MFVGLLVLIASSQAAVCDAAKICGNFPVVWCEPEAPEGHVGSCATIRPWMDSEVPDDKVRYRFACESGGGKALRKFYCKVGEDTALNKRSAQVSREFAQGKPPTDYSTLPPPPPPPPIEPVAERCENETACSSRETYMTCDKAPCAVQADPSVLARKVCERGEFTAWCVKTPDAQPASSGCLCDHGSPRESGLGVLLLLLVARNRRKPA